MKLTSTAFNDLGEMPAAYTCQGSDRSPPLAWSGAPTGTRTFALIVDDPDAPDPRAPKLTWVHWVLANLPASTTALEGGVGAQALPRGTVQGKNDWKRLGYGGPCPPVGRHRYFFKLYALDTALSLADGMTKSELEHAMEGHVLAESVLMATYEKSR